MKDESSSRESAEDQRLAQRLRDEGMALGSPHARELAERILAARSARPAHGGWPIGPGHARPGGPLASAVRLRLAGAAVLLTVAMVGCVIWLHRPSPAGQPGVDVLSQLSLGGL